MNDFGGLGDEPYMGQCSGLEREARFEDREVVEADTEQRMRSEDPPSHRPFILATTASTTEVRESVKRAGVKRQVDGQTGGGDQRPTQHTCPLPSEENESRQQRKAEREDTAAGLGGEEADCDEPKSEWE